MYKHMFDTVQCSYYIAVDGTVKSVHKHNGKEHIMQTYPYKGDMLLYNNKLFMKHVGTKRISELLAAYYN